MSHRLPRTISPTHYDIELAPDLAASSFAGTVSIACDVVSPTDELVCNAIDLEFSEVRIDGVAVNFELDAALEQLRIDLGDRPAGPLEFAADFVGTLNDDLRGFYRSTFDDEAGNEQVIATTQFQSTDARRAFPCWDEPDFKATFAVTLLVASDLMAVSNGKELSRSPEAVSGASRDRVKFATTMKMSTYLVAFVVGPLEATEPRFAGDTPIRIVHQPGKGHLSAFALDVAVAALEYFEEYYGIAYPTDKLDMIALPDFAMGAMENLGCVTYREILLLVDPDEATQPELQNVADVINHELAHMWFGDLVTMGWWNGIWLNEAFATFMEMKATDSFAPDWQRWTSFGISRSEAFDVDSLLATRPIEFPVESPSDAEAMFDILTYEKGAAVVRMLEQWLGEETFRAGIRSYLTTHAYANTETHDLWDALEAESGRPVRSAMETWIFQGGYPVVSIESGSNQHSCRLHQERFTYLDMTAVSDPPSRSEIPGDALWTIPVGIEHRDGSVITYELDAADLEIQIAVSEIAKLNRNGNGFYRVRWPEEQLQSFVESGLNNLDAVERYGLVDDTWALTLARQVPLPSFVELLAAYQTERDISVWQRILGALSFIRHACPDGSLPGLASTADRLMAEAVAQLGLEPATDEPARTTQLRGALFSARGVLADNSDCVALARELFATPDLDPEMRSACIKVISATGTDAEFAQFKAEFLAGKTPQEEIRFLYSLADFPGAHHLAELTEMALDGSIRSQNAPFVLARAMMHREHGPATWAQVSQRWDDVNEMFPSNTIVRMLTGVRWLTQPNVAAGVFSFFEERPILQGQKQLDQHLERLRVNASFADTLTNVSL